MKYVNAKGLGLSAFALGTVQLGMQYGLGEDSAKPSEEKSFAMLDAAMALGINTLDTANNYGDSEAVIGRWMAKRKAENKRETTHRHLPAQRQIQDGKGARKTICRQKCAIH